MQTRYKFYIFFHIGYRWYFDLGWKGDYITQCKILGQAGPTFNLTTTFAWLATWFWKHCWLVMNCFYWPISSVYGLRRVQIMQRNNQKSWNFHTYKFCSTPYQQAQTVHLPPNASNPFYICKKYKRKTRTKAVQQFGLLCQHMPHGLVIWHGGLVRCWSRFLSA